MKNVLFHVSDKEKKKQILGLCRKMGVSVKWLKKSDLIVTIGELAEMEACRGKGTVGNQLLSGKMPDGFQGFEMPDVMVFSGFQDGKLDEFLEGYRKAGIAPIGLKAVVTPYNVGWSLGGLIGEIREEHDRMGKK